MLISGALLGQDLLIGVDYHYQKADSLYEVGNYEEALVHLRKGLLTSKNDADLNVLRAKCHLKLNEISLAQKYLRRASRIGSYKADKMLDSLESGSRRTEASEQFKEELEEYLNRTKYHED